MPQAGFVFEVGFERAEDGELSYVCSPDDKDVLGYLMKDPHIFDLIPGHELRIVVRTDFDADFPEFTYLHNGAPVDPDLLNEPAMTFLRKLVILGVIRVWRQSQRKMRDRLERFLLTEASGLDPRIQAEA